MEPTRRAVGVAGVAGALAALAALLARPALLAGAAAVGGWLLARQYRFRRTLAAVDRGLTVGQRPTPDAVRAGEEGTLHLTATLPAPVDATVSVGAVVPAAASVATSGASGLPPDYGRVSLAPGETTSETTVGLSWPVAGTVTLERPSVTVTDGTDLFRARLRRGETPTVTVRPRIPTDLHVGRGGDAAASFGDHPTGRMGPGVDAAEVREYVPGDPASRIDWAATARLGRPHVREFEVTAAAGTWLVVDAGPAMATGPEGRTPADFGRQVALAEVAAARARGDPVGVTVVGADGPTAERAPATGADHYRDVRTLLHDVGPTADEGATGRPDASRSTATGSVTSLAPGTPMAEALSPFADGSVGPTGGSGRGTARTTDAGDSEDPLVTTAARTARHTAPRTVLVTTDADRDAVEAAVARARDAGSRVRVYLAPTALFAADGPVDLETAADRYRRFESFRRRLDGLDGVTSYEVAPGDRLAAARGGGRGRHR